jgi:hypothetical protein
MDVFRQLTGLRLQDVYNLSLKKGGRSVRRSS